ncbi:MAG: hypothetical protein KatS3mg108_2368 [Isosphaeraceae bacterium]|jgi:hypothetical membrane protein|nr:MAG: hypothetical protein KatS3mg108_2368 [Isosphaeraceae bacterium]
MDLHRICFVVPPSLIVMLQMVGVLGLVLSRCLPSHRWGVRGRRLLVLAMIGLGLAGVVHGQHRSGEALFAGATMAFLMVGMISGTTPVRNTLTTPRAGSAEPVTAV